MIEKFLFAFLLAFVIIEAIGLVLHVLDEVRTMGDRKYYRKQQEQLNAFNRESYELSKHQKEILDDYRKQVASLLYEQTDIKVRLSQVEDKLKKPVKKTSAKKPVKKTSEKKGETK